MQASELEVIVLASKITDVLIQHPDAYTAETACAIALEIARLRVKQTSLQWRSQATRA